MVSQRTWMIGVVLLANLSLAQEKEPADQPPPFELKELIDTTDLAGRPLLLHPVLQDGRLYTIGLRNTGASAVAQLITMPLDKGGVHLRGELALPKRFGTPHEGEVLFISAGLLLGDSYIAAVKDVGLVAFSTTSNEVIPLVAAEQLPQEAMQSMVAVRGQLYVSVAGGKLLRIGLMTGDAKILAARDDGSPFDGRAAFDIPRIFADSYRDRLLLFTLDRHDNGRGGEVWEYRLKDEKLNRLARLGRVQLGLAGDLRANTLMMADTWFLNWNLKTDKKYVVANYQLGDLPFDRKYWVSRLPHAPVFCQGSFWWLGHDGRIGKFSFPDGEPEIYLSGRPAPAGCGLWGQQSGFR